MSSHPLVITIIVLAVPTGGDVGVDIRAALVYVVRQLGLLK
jgi:hypothetical protein